MNQSKYEEIMQHLIDYLMNLPSKSEIPVAAAIIDENLEIVSKSINLITTDLDPTAHAEIVAIRQAAKKLQNNRLDSYSLISTLEPCLMCAGAISQARINKVIFGAYEPKTGFVSSLFPTIKEFQPKLEVLGGVLEDKCSKILTNWFSLKR
jgi:tRNA(adenine34) deaminase